VYPRSQIFTLGEHGNSKTDPFLWGLLPDNEKVLDQWSKKFQASSRNAFVYQNVANLFDMIGQYSMRGQCGSTA
jgi:HipA-like protein